MFPQQQSTMLRALSNQHITNVAELRTLLERHRRELVQPVSEVKRNAIIAQHEVELRLFTMDEMLARYAPEVFETLEEQEDEGHAYKLANAILMNQRTRHIHGALLEIIEGLDVGLTIVEGLVAIGMPLNLRGADGRYVPVREKLAAVREKLRELDAAEVLQPSLASLTVAFTAELDRLAEFEDADGQEALDAIRVKMDDLMCAVGDYFVTPDEAKPEAAELAEPELAEPEAAELAEPELAKPEAAEPEAAEPT